MTLAGLTTGCNQKSNRDPVTSYDQDDVEETLQGLRKKGAVVRVEGSGRVEKWRHNLYDLLELREKAAQMAVLAELLLRGPQTEGDLRARASRMDDIADLPTLQNILTALIDHGLVAYLTPPEQKRGAIVSHTLYPPAELERLRQSAATHARAAEPAAEPGSPRGGEASPVRAALDELKGRVETLEEQVRSILGEIRDLKSELGS
jgi:uncharacterized protein YceH (UPF0502 family)